MDQLIGYKFYCGVCVVGVVDLLLIVGVAVVVIVRVGVLMCPGIGSFQFISVLQAAAHKDTTKHRDVQHNQQ